MLHREIFHQLQTKTGPFTIDLLCASRTNSQLYTAAGSQTRRPWWWMHCRSLGRIITRMFPPFALIPHCRHKIEEEEVTALLVAPVWSNQTWFPLLIEFLIDYQILLPPIPDIVTNPYGLNHPVVIKGHFPLPAWPVLGSHTARRDFQELSASSSSPGDHQLNPPINLPGNSGIAGVLHETLIHFQLL